MAVAKAGNRKLNAKLQALLYGANHILGDMTAAHAARARYKEFSTAVTNPWTLALTRLIFAVLANPRGTSPSTLATPHSSLTDTPFGIDLKPTSKAQRLLAEEYAYYFS